MNSLTHPLTHLVNLASPLTIQGYIDQGGYQGAEKAIKENSPAEVLEIVKASGLKGRGGAGFPTGMKWSFVPQYPENDERSKDNKYLVCNADEMEPGTFKDRLVLEGAPHQLIEAMIIAAYTIGANKAYIFLRGEYHLAAKRLQIAIDEAYQASWLGNDIQKSNFQLDLYLHTSAGRYICGEETALINAL
ncbi:NADH-quinone oxidoreductase subunit F, partial [bacterium]|nr:NADH-quinone oxidoreductase subunit F [bacterium]